MRVRIFPYNLGSRSAKLLSQLSGWLRLRGSNSAFRPRREDVVINWGSTRCPDFGCRVLNPAQSIINATNKKTALEILNNAGVKVPAFVHRHGDIPAGQKYVARAVLSGHSGDGITVGQASELPTDCPLYTRYIRKSNEFRVHVVGGRAIFTQRKARKLDNPNPNWEVRNLANGFVYVEYPTTENALSEIAVKACQALGLDFGAVDVIQSKENDELYVLEVNTACGLEERTAEKYVESLYTYIDQEERIAA